MSWNEGWNDGSGKGKYCKLRPHEPTLVDVEGLEGEGSEGVEVPIAINDPDAEQETDKVGVRNVC